MIGSIWRSGVSRSPAPAGFRCVPKVPARTGLEGQALPARPELRNRSGHTVGCSSEGNRPDRIRCGTEGTQGYDRAVGVDPPGCLVSLRARTVAGRGEVSPPAPTTRGAFASGPGARTSSPPCRWQIRSPFRSPIEIGSFESSFGSAAQEPTGRASPGRPRTGLGVEGTGGADGERWRKRRRDDSSAAGNPRERADGTSP